MTHLGVAASALVDDQLDDDTKRRMIAHLAGCASCRAAVDTERAVKAHVAAASRPPAVPASLLVSLASIAYSEPRSLEPALPRQSGWPGGWSIGVVPRGRYVAAAGLAASVVVGLGGASLARGAGSVARPPTGPRPSTSTIETALTSTPAVPSRVVAASSSPASTPFDTRPMLRQQGGLALSAVYRQP
jgi:anti-sigma factor RsiW